MNLLLLLLTAPCAAALPDLDVPLRTSAVSPNDAAVVVGLEDYLVAPDVPFAWRDAAAVLEWLVQSRGVPAARVTHLRRGAREDIERAVAERGTQVGPEGTLWFYFAGHGAASPESGARLLLGDDARPDPSAFARRGVAVDALKHAGQAGGGRVVMLLDTCYTGQGRGGTELAAGKRFLVPAYATSPGERALIWSAASPSEMSGPLDGARHGAFTWFALGALRGWADGQLDGVRDYRVTAQEAQLFVGSRPAAVMARKPAARGRGAPGSCGHVERPTRGSHGATAPPDGPQMPFMLPIRWAGRALGPAGAVALRSQRQWPLHGDWQKRGRIGWCRDRARLAAEGSFQVANRRIVSALLLRVRRYDTPTAGPI